MNYGPPYYDNPNLITELRHDVLGPEISHNHANTIRLEGLQRRQEHRAYKLVIDQTFGSAELLLCGLAQMTELFSAETLDILLKSNTRNHLSVITYI